MSLPANALTTVAMVCAELSLDVPTSGSATEADLERRIAVASDAIERYCARAFGRVVAYVERVPGFGTDALFLSRVPVLSVSAVTYDGDVIPPECYESPPSGADSEAGLLRNVDADAPVWAWTARCGAWGGKQAGTERRAYAVTYTAGYVLPKDGTDDEPRTLPYDVEHACILTVVSDYQMKGRDQSIVSESVLSASVTYAGSQVNSAIGRGTGGIIPDAAATLLQPYRRTT